MRSLKPLVSICIPTYNYGHFLGDAIDAALAQTYPNIEVVVTDNASTDTTQHVLERYAHDSRVRVFRNPQTLPMAENHWLALTRAQGEFVVNIPSDDVLLPNFVADAYSMYERANGAIDIVYASLSYGDEQLRPLAHRSCLGFVPCEYTGGRNEFRELLRMAHMRWQTLFTPKAVFDELGPIDTSLSVQWDWEYFLRMAASGKRFGYLPRIHAIARNHGTNASSSGTFISTIRELDEYLTILTRYTAPQYAARMDGIERTLLKHIDRFVAHIRARDPLRYTPEHDRRVARYRAQLETALAQPLPPHTHAPETTVILPTTGVRLWQLRRALEALAAQTTTDFEIVVVQNGGESLEGWFSGFGLGSRLRSVYIPVAVGTAAARNIGLKLSAGRFIAYCDDDAVFAPEHVARLGAALRQTGAEIAYAAAGIIIAEPDSSPSGMREVTRLDGAFGTPQSGDNLRVANSLPLPAVMHRFRAIEQCGYFSETAGMHHDWLTLLAIGSRHGFVYVPLPSVDITYITTQVTSMLGAADAAQYTAAVDAVYAHLPGARSDQQLRYRDVAGRAFEMHIQAGRDATSLKRFLLAAAGQSDNNSAHKATTEKRLVIGA